MKHVLSVLALVLGVQANATNNPIICAIRTVSGNYLTAVDSGGRITDVMHSDATQVSKWEKFMLVDTGQKDGSVIRYGVAAYDRHYLTAVNGGGRTSDVIRSVARSIGPNEIFKFIPLGPTNTYAIQVANGGYLTAVGGGGRISDVLHSDASVVRAWETFRVVCGY